MKNNIKILLLMVAGLASGLLSCNDEFSQPPVNVPEGGIGTGTWDNPMTAYQALLGSVNEDLGFTPWVTGYIVGYVDTSIGSVINDNTASFSLPANAASNILLAMDPDERDWHNCATVRLAYQTEARYDLNLRDHPENLGALVTVKGTTGQTYLGQYGVRDVEAYNFDNKGLPGLDGPEPDIIYSSLPSDAETTDWTFIDVTLPSGAHPIWSWKQYNENHYLNGSANSVKGETLAYAISPVIDLSDATGCAVTFSHAAKFQTTLRTLCKFAIRKAGTTEWTEIEIPKWPSPGTWGFVGSGNIDISAFDGESVEIAFKYASNDEGADTWEINNLKVTGHK